MALIDWFTLLDGLDKSYGKVFEHCNCWMDFWGIVFPFTGTEMSSVCASYWLDIEWYFLINQTGRDHLKFRVLENCYTIAFYQDASIQLQPPLLFLKSRA